MISSFFAPSLPSLPPSDLLDGAVNGDSRKWLSPRCFKSMSFRSLIVLTLLFLGIVIFEHYTEGDGQRTRNNFFKPPNHIEHAIGRSPCEAGNPGYHEKVTDGLPRGIIEQTSDLYFRALGGDPVQEVRNIPASQSLLTMPVGIKQKETVNKIIEKFPAENFTIMLFHYDGIVDEWNMFPWSSRSIHVVAVNQTKWWFAKRFLHPDIVTAYKYIFLWDEDIGVENFHATRYLDVVENEGLEISQPALDPRLSEIHHLITARKSTGKVHRKTYKFRGSGLCFDNSTQPPCTGWVEMMVPVFSQAAWRCTWYMIQNDLVHAWGLDMKLGYCAQGDRTRKVGVVDDQYVVHYGIPSLGGLLNSTWDRRSKGVNTESQISSKKDSTDSDFHDRWAVRKRSYVELEIFKRRWDAAAKLDQCWVDPY